MFYELDEHELISLDGGITLAKGGQILGGAVAIIAGGMMIYTGNIFEGALAVGGGVAAIASAF